MAKQREIAPIRSSAAEYLTFVAASGNGGVEAVYADENVWLSQKMMAQLYDVDVRTVNYHLKTVFAVSELEAASVIQKFRITAVDGKGYDTQHYKDVGRVTAENAKAHAESEFEKYRIVRDRLFESDFDRVVGEVKRLKASAGTAQVSAAKKAARKAVSKSETKGSDDVA